MSLDLIKKLVIWAPTLLFVLSLGFYFLVGVIRGLRKSVILLIHAAASMAICLTIFFIIVKSENIDVTMVNIANYILNFFGTSVQKIIGVSENLESIKDMILFIVTNNMSNEELYYYIVIDSGAYISTLVEMCYRIILAIILIVVHLLLVGFLNLIYTIFYPVRRKARRINKAYENGVLPTPYKKKRLAGGFVGVGRGLVVNVILFSVVGCLLYVVTGQNHPLPERHDGTDEEITFGDDRIDMIYDGYGWVCEMSDFGIFKVFNSIKDSEDTPYYYYICDLILQGGIEDKNLEISDTFYLREELGTYVGFCKDAVSLFLEYVGSDITVLLGGSSEEISNILTDVIKNPDFISKFSTLIDEFEKQPFFISVGLSALTSIVNHIEMVVGEDHVVTRLVKKVFNDEDGLKVTDLATEQDIKYLFKTVLNVASTALVDMEENPKSKMTFVNAAEESAFDVELVIKYANLFIDSIQQLSLFTDRSDVGNNLLRNVYEFCVDEFVGSSVVLPDSSTTKWIDEINILFDSIEPVLNIAIEIFDENTDILLENAMNMFNPENENIEFIEENYNKIIEQLSKSNLLDLVFRVAVPGEMIDDLIKSMTGNPDAIIPHNFTFATSGNKTGELEILLNSLRDFLKHDGAEFIELVQEEINGETLTRMFEILGQDIDESEEVELRLIDEVLESKILRYVLSSFVTYSDFGAFKIYIPESASDVIQEVVLVEDENGNKVEETRVHNVVKKEELSVLTEFILNSPDFIIDLIDQSEEIDYVELLTSEEIIDLLNDSCLLQGIIASVIISVSEDMDMIVLPYTYDDPETWIQNKEVKAIIDAVLTLQNEETESGESLFNELMGGNVDINTILDLSQETIDSVYKSDILKYTISNLLTNLGSEGFAIVVPGVSCEKPNAKTTVPDKYVNVISSEEILKIFDQIKNIIEFDSNNNVTILYSKMFNNKEEILSSYTIQATVMNMLIGMTGSEEDIISVPKEYIDAFNEFVKLSSFDGLKNNKWFNDPSNPAEKETIIDDELYLLFEGIEKLVSNEYKDENGNIKDNFSLDKIASDIQIDNTTIDIVTSSAVLNSTLSNVISSNFATPLSVYHDDKIDKSELECLFDCLFKLLNKEKLTFDDFASIDINSIEITKTDINNVYKKSEIFMTALSSMIMDVENISLPMSATVQIDIVDMKDKNNVHRIIDETLVEEGKVNEFDNLIDCLFMFFGSENGEVLNVSKINVDTLKLDESKIDKITSSVIFTATISTIISTTEVIIPVEVADYAQMANGTREYILSPEELNSLLKTFLEMFGSVNEGGVNELDVNNINLDNFIIDTEVRNKIVDTAVLRATISNYLITKDLGVIIPKIENTTEEIQIIGSDNLHVSITKDELGNFLDAAIKLFGNKNENDEQVLSINHINTSDFVINDENISILGSSTIINTTITQELAKLDDLVIPLKNNGEDIAVVTFTADNNSSCGYIKDIESFMSDMLDILGGEEREINPSHLSTVNIELVKGEDIDGILWATISKQMLDNDSILIPNNTETLASIDVLTNLNGEVVSSEKELITHAQFNEFKDTLVEVLGNESGGKKVFNLSLETGIDVSNMIITKSHVTEGDENYLFDSTIFTATVAKTILEVDGLTVPTIIQKRIDFYNQLQVLTIGDDQVRALFNALFISMGIEELNISNFNIDEVNLPNTEAGVAEMFESFILAGTVSNSITTSASSSIVVLDQCMGSFEYEGKTNAEKFITIEELSNLILAFTIGLGKTSAGNLDISNIAIPETDEKINALVKSTIIRATISKEIMNQQDIEMSIEVDACEEDNFTWNGNKVLLITESEIRTLIKGLITLGLSENGTFDNINLDIVKIVTSGQNSIISVAYSSVLRSIITDTLLTTDSSEIPYYKNLILGFTSDEYNGSYVYDEDSYTINYEYTFYYNTAVSRGYYVLNDPEIKEVYTSFEINGAENASIFQKNDVLALLGPAIIKSQM